MSVNGRSGPEDTSLNLIFPALSTAIILEQGDMVAWFEFWYVWNVEDGLLFVREVPAMVVLWLLIGFGLDGFRLQSEIIESAQKFATYITIPTVPILLLRFGHFSTMVEESFEEILQIDSCFTIFRHNHFFISYF